MIDMTVEEGAQQVIGMIADSVSAGHVPWDVPDFSALHDFVDANCYLIDLVDEFNSEDEAQQEFLYAVENRVAEMLAGGKRPPMWSIDHDKYHDWLTDRKYALRASRAAGFGLTIEQMTAHDEF